MINFLITIAKDDSTQLEQLKCNFPINEWQTIITFYTEVERLRSTRYVQNGRGGHISFGLEQGSPTIKLQEIDQDEVGAMLLKLRPFILKNEKLYFHKVKNILYRELNHTAFSKLFSELNCNFKLENMNSKLTLRSNETQILTVDFVMDWLNSFEYHRDQNKKKYVTETLDFLGQIQNGQSVILFALTEMIKAILYLGSIIKAIIELENGTRKEIKFAAKYFE